MLIDTNGKPVDSKTLPKGRDAREAVLKGLREVPAVTTRVRTGFFSLDQRARIVDKRK